MFTKHIQARPVVAALRTRANFSVAVATEEFPHAPLAARKAAPAVIGSQTLGNGVRVVTRARESSIVNLQFAVVGGSSTETAAQKGAAHFLSVAAYAGNKKNTGLRIVRFLESLGAQFSATADREKIVYNVSVLSDKVEPVFAALVSAIASPPHAAYILDEVRENAAMAYGNFNSCPKAQLQALLHETAYGETSPLGGAQFAANLGHLTTEAILEYRNNHFIRNNLVIAANGASVEQIKQLSDLYTAGVAGSEGVKVLPESLYIGGDNKVRADLGGKTNLALAFEAPAGSNGKAFQVLSEVLGSRLAAKGVCASSFIHQHSKSGLIGVHTSGCAATASKNMAIAIDELKTIASGSGDITNAKTKVALNNFAALEGKNSTTFLLNSFLAGEDAAKLADVRSITPQNVSEAAVKMLMSVPTYSVYGATAGTPTYSAIQKLLA